jgi:TIR domain
MPNASQAVFLSYASQDAQAAVRICEGLRAAGFEVWFDRSELRGGDAWDASIRRQVKECALFVPIISASTNSRPEGYFRREWNLAVERMLDMSNDRPFLLPVVIDDSSEARARVPDRFLERQWMWLEGGVTSPDFIDHIAGMLAGLAGENPSVARDLPIRRGSVPVAAVKRRIGTIVVVLSITAIVIAVAVVAIVWMGLQEPVPPRHHRALPDSSQNAVDCSPVQRLGELRDARSPSLVADFDRPVGTRLDVA